MTQIEQVYEFNELMGFVPPTTVGIPDEKTSDFIRDSLNEEMTEIEQAFIDQDVVKLVDGLVDLTYFAFGHLRKLGLSVAQAEECFQAVHEANMTKRRGKMAARNHFEDDAIKPPGFEAPDEVIRKILEI